MTNPSIQKDQLAKEAAQWLQPASLAYKKSRGWLQAFIAERKADNTPKLTENNCIDCGKLNAQKGATHTLCPSCWGDLHGYEGRYEQ